MVWFFFALALALGVYAIGASIEYWRKNRNWIGFGEYILLAFMVVLGIAMIWFSIFLVTDHSYSHWVDKCHAHGGTVISDKCFPAGTKEIKI